MSVSVLRVKPTYCANIYRPEEFDTGLKIRVLDEARQRGAVVATVLRIDDFACPIFGHTNEKEQPSYGLHRKSHNSLIITPSNFAQLYEPALCNNNIMKF